MGRRVKTILGDISEDGRTNKDFIKALAVGFITGFTGIVVDPAKGAVRDGVVGFGKGFVTGTLGVLFKPGAGMQDLALLKEFL